MWVYKKYKTYRNIKEIVLLFSSFVFNSNEILNLILQENDKAFYRYEQYFLLLSVLSASFPYIWSMIILSIY